MWGMLLFPLQLLEQQVQGAGLQGACVQPGRPGVLSRGVALRRQGCPVSAQGPRNSPLLVTYGSWGEAAAGPRAYHLPQPIHWRQAGPSQAPRSSGSSPRVSHLCLTLPWFHHLSAHPTSSFIM